MNKISSPQLGQIDLNLFVVFDAVYREQNLTRASEVLFLSQPAVSHALARLRERLDDPLFERQGKRMMPTPFAASIIDDVREGLSRLQHATFKDAVFAPATSERNFNLAMPSVLETTLLQELVVQLHREAPNITLKSMRVSRSDVEQQLKAGKIQLAVDIYLPVSEEIGHSRLSGNPMVVMARPGHPLIPDNMDQWNLDNYLNGQHIFVTSRQAGMGAEDVALSKLGKQRNISISCQHYFAASRIVAETDLLLTIPESYAQLLAQRIDCVLLPFPLDTELQEMHLYWLKKSELDPAQRWFKSFFAHSLESVSEKWQEGII